MSLETWEAVLVLVGGFGGMLGIISAVYEFYKSRRQEDRQRLAILNERMFKPWSSVSAGRDEDGSISFVLPESPGRTSRSMVVGFSFVSQGPAISSIVDFEFGSAELKRRRPAIWAKWTEAEERRRQANLARGRLLDAISTLVSHSIGQAFPFVRGIRSNENLVVDTYIVEHVQDEVIWASQDIVAQKKSPVFDLKADSVNIGGAQALQIGNGRAQLILSQPRASGQDLTRYDALLKAMSSDPRVTGPTEALVRARSLMDGKLEEFREAMKRFASEIDLLYE